MKHCFTLLLSLATLLSIRAQDTFSIVAVDSVTGEVGSAGATCLQAPQPPIGALIISDVVPGKGAIHTQALWNAYNQENARGYMLQGASPADILAQINLDDYDGDSTVRQYGIAMFDTAGRVRTGAFTGSGAYDYKNHNVGTYYSIQGNILLGQYILDSMEARFLRTQGPLAERLMAALQGANVPGADSRCLAEGVPSQSAFVRVAKPTDTDSTLYLHLVVKSRPYGMSPIDSLQTLFNAWRVTHPSGVNEVERGQVKLFPNPASHYCMIQFAAGKEHRIEVFDMTGKLVYETKVFASCRISTANFAKGTYLVRVNGVDHKLLVE